MESVLASSLRGCDVMTTNGTKIGTVENVSMDPETGRLAFLHLGSYQDDAGGFDRIEDGQLLVPADRIEAKQEYVLVRPPR
jgi:sporulation protein YlmC with PRC-barrel domain